MSGNSPNLATAGAIVYGGFWLRTAASLIDTLLLGMVLAPLLGLIYGRRYWQGGVGGGSLDLAINYLLPAVAIILFWIWKSATPGKMLLRLRIVDAKSGGVPSPGQFIIRYLGYYVSTLPLMLGFLWVAFDRRKQGWHDKLAGTVVIRYPAAQQTTALPATEQSTAPR